MAQKLDILVVEDEAEQIKQVDSLLRTRVERGAINGFQIASTLRQAIKLLEKRGYAGIISDVFFPSDLEDDMEIRRSLSNMLKERYLDDQRPLAPYWLRAIKSWEEGKELAPMGVKIAEYALAERMPIFLCTNTNHHGYKTQAVYDWANMGRVRIIDKPESLTDGGEGQAKTKEWSMAYFGLAYLIEGISSGRFFIDKNQIDWGLGDHGPLFTKVDGLFLNADCYREESKLKEKVKEYCEEDSTLKDAFAKFCSGMFV
jgi:CheY-like chemotaxis protein